MFACDRGAGRSSATELRAIFEKMDQSQQSRSILPRTAARRKRDAQRVATDPPNLLHGNPLADMSEIAKAVEFLVTQSVRSMTHELVVTPAGDRWVP